jgi:hypothetical protein
MSMPFPITFAAPTSLLAALALLCCAGVAAALRRPTWPITTWTLCAIGAALIALAAGSPHARREIPAHVAVMIDLSPSTRGATFHDPAKLWERLAQLLGSTPYRLYAFSGGGSTRPMTLQQLPLEEATALTTLAPPIDADAIVLFSDARFHEPLPVVLPPTYLVIDAAMEQTADGRVEQIELGGTNAREVAVTVFIGGETPRRLELTGTRDPSPRTVAPGRSVVTAQIDPAAKHITARLDRDDLWPENDSLELLVPQPARLERWWVSVSSAAPTGWRHVAPSDLSGDSQDYLAPSIIVLDNVSAAELAPAAQLRLAQYVRELGGSLLILGGDRAFAAGGYVGESLDALSPLSSAPPRPMTHWILLADASGSMAAPAGGGGTTRWQAATQALLGAVQALPSDDLLSIASFARELRWWTRSQSVRDVATRLNELLPRDLLPQGPTNLEAALQQIAEASRDNMPTELLILSDADASVSEPRALAQKLKARRVRVHLLATTPLTTQNPVRAIVEETDGKLVTQEDVARWAHNLRQLLRSAAPNHVERNPVEVTFAPELNLPPRQAELWNRVWPKEGTEILATARPNESDGTIAMAATRREGVGRVTSVAFTPSVAEVERLVALAEQAPRDPRYSVSWSRGAQPRITLDAVDRAATRPYLVDLKPLVRLFSDGGPELSIALAQTAPGRYEATLPPSPSPRVAAVIVNDRVIDRSALSGRYPPEFDAIGNDRSSMNDLARRSGGRIIEPNERGPLALHGATRAFDLTSLAAVAGAALVGLGLFWWRRSS